MSILTLPLLIGVDGIWLAVVAAEAMALVCTAGFIAVSYTHLVVRQREEIAMQISALKGMKEMAAAYGFDISQPAANAKEAVQWLSLIHIFPL